MTEHEPMQVLVVEHDAWTRRSLSTMLDEAGFAVEEASNGMSALRIAAAAPPRIVMIGPALPEIGPVEVLSTLRSRQETRNSAVLRVGPAQLQAATEGFVSWPCSKSELLASVLNALESCRASGDSAQAGLPIRSVSASARGI